MFTGYTFCIPLPDKKAETVLKAYMDHVYCKHGGSLKILSDNGTEFKNKLMEEVKNWEWNTKYIHLPIGHSLMEG